MNEKDIIRQIMSHRNITQLELAKILGMKSQSGVSERLRGKSIRVDTFTKWLNAMNCDVIVRDRQSGKEYTVE